MHLRMLTLNTWSLPWPVSRDAPQRLAAIAERLAGFRADVVAFQEIASRDFYNNLVTAGRRAGFRHVWPAPGAAHGGLALLSKLPIRRSRFTRYLLNGLPERVTHGDYFLGKGIAELSLDSDSGPISLLVTHLHARYSGRQNRTDYLGHRAAQIIELAHAFSRTSDPAIALGDFNFHEGSAHYQIFMGLTGATDVAAALDRRENTVLWENPYRRRGHRPGRRIDYAFTRDGQHLGARAVTSRRVLDESLLIDGRRRSYSDHAGLLVELAVGEAPGRIREPEPEAVWLAERMLEVGRRKAMLRRSQERRLASGGAVACLTALSAGRRWITSRRGLLKAAALGIPGLGLASCAGLTGLSEAFIPAEIDRYDEVAELLDGLCPAG